MSDANHWDGCWAIHDACARIELRRLQVENTKLRNGKLEPDWMASLREHRCCDTLTGPVVTHGVVLKLHGQGPIHSHHNDEPPTR